MTLAAPTANSRQYWRLDYITHYPKKGTGGYEGDWAKYGTSWNYNWDRVTGANLPAHVVFAPMQHNRWWPDWDTLRNSTRPGTPPAGPSGCSASTSRTTLTRPT